MSELSVLSFRGQRSGYIRDIIEISFPHQPVHVSCHSGYAQEAPLPDFSEAGAVSFFISKLYNKGVNLFLSFRQFFHDAPPMRWDSAACRPSA